MSDKKGLTLADLEKKVAEQMIALMERDGLRWIKGWATPLPPQNFATGHVYQGTNIFTTGLWMMLTGKSDPRFLTFKQAIDLGGAIRKGSKGIPIVFYGTMTREDEQGEERRSRFAKISYVFHVSDVDGVEIPAIDLASAAERTRNERIDSFVAGTNVTIKDAASAFYRDADDAIYIPPIGMFIDTGGVSAEDHYYSTLLHELIHFTGVPKRLDRDCFRNYHKERASRAFEELIAEIGSVMLGQRLGIQTEPREDNAAYVQSWIKCLTDKPGSVMQAASAAAKAITFLEQLQPQPQQEAA